MVGHDPRQQIRRREFLRLLSGGTIALSTANILSGCGGGGSGSSAAGKSAIALVNDGITVGTDGGNIIFKAAGDPVSAILAAKNINGYNAIYWGTRDANQLPQHVTQNLVWASDPNNSARTLYDETGVPAQSISTATGQFISFDWSVAGQCTLLSYDVNSSPLGGAVVTIVGGAATAVAPISGRSVGTRSPALRRGFGRAVHRQAGDQNQQALDNIDADQTQNAIIVPQIVAIAKVFGLVVVATALVAEVVAAVGMDAVALLAIGTAIASYSYIIKPAVQQVGAAIEDITTNVYNSFFPNLYGAEIPPYQQWNPNANGFSSPAQSVTVGIS